MPLLFLGLGSLGIGAGFKLFGSGAQDTTNAAKDLIITVSVIGAVYLVAKKQKVI